MLSYGSCALLVETAVFLVLAVVALWEYHRSTQQSAVRHQQGRGGHMTLLQTEEAESGNNGTKARHQINLTLACACTARAILTAFLSLSNSWLPYLAVPDLLYIALYCFIIVLLAQMRQMNKNQDLKLFRSVRLYLLTSLAGVLIASLVVCTARWATDPLCRNSLFLRKFLYLELGVTYLVMFAIFIYFGVRVCICVVAPNKRLFYRILVLTVVCGAAMSTKGVFFVAAAANDSETDALFPNSAGSGRFEALIALEELLPSITIAYLTARGKGRRSRAEVVLLPSENTGFARWGSQTHVYNTNTNGGIDSPGTPGARYISFSYGSHGFNHA